MLRSIAIFGCAFALAITASVGFEAEAAKARSKQCLASGMGMTAAKTKWKCKAAEKCCFDWLANKGTCVPASAVCL